MLIFSKFIRQPDVKKRNNNAESEKWPRLPSNCDGRNFFFDFKAPKPFARGRQFCFVYIFFHCPNVTRAIHPLIIRFYVGLIEWTGFPFHPFVARSNRMVASVAVLVFFTYSLANIAKTASENEQLVIVFLAMRTIFSLFWPGSSVRYGSWLFQFQHIFFLLFKQ